MPRIAKELTKQTQIDANEGKDFTVGGITGFKCDYRRERPCYYIQWNKEGKRHTFYIGNKTLKQAREEAKRLRALIDDGKDPNELARQEKERLEAERLKALENTYTLSKVSKEWFEREDQQGHWSNSGDRDREWNRLKKNVLAIIGGRPIGSITAQELANLFNPIYLEHSETAKKVLTTLRAIFIWAKVSKQYGEIHSPIDDEFAELVKTAKKHKPEVKNYPALPFKQIPLFIKALLEHGTTTALATVFSILTASRSKAFRLAQWKEINFDDQTWIVSKEHDKQKLADPKKRTIFLNTQAVALLKKLPRFSDNQEDVLFALYMENPQRAMSDNAISSLIRKTLHPKKKEQDGIGWIDPSKDNQCITQHGTARSGFKTWSRDDESGNHMKFDETAVELCLLHKITDNYNGAYDRHYQERHRREIMQAWGDFCFQGINLEDYLK